MTQFLRSREEKAYRGRKESGGETMEQYGDRNVLMARTIAARVADLRWHGGEHFFDPDNHSVFPEPDFWLCTKYDRFDFVLRVERDEYGFISRKIGV